MRLFAGLLLVLGLLLAGCGSGSPDDLGYGPAPEETASSSSEPTETPSATVAENDLLALVSESDVGGEVSPEAVPLDSPTAIADFSAQFDDERMGASISTALAATPVPDGLTVVGAVVAIGCEPPTEVEIETGPEGVRISAAPVKSDQQCLVPVTTVALVAVAAG